MTNAFRAKIIKQGNSSVVVIPVPIMEAGYEVGEYVGVILEKEKGSK